MTDDIHTTQRLRLLNDKSHDQTVCLEPWGTHLTLYPDDALDVVVESPRPGTLEVATGDDILTVFAWEGATFAVYRDGDLLSQSRVAVPPIPNPVNA